MASRQIATLPAASRSIIRSTTIVTSLSQIILELVQNSLDAGASKVDVGVNVGEWQCWVRDDGVGMDRSGMSLLAKGGEEGRYGSSKAYDPASLGSVSTFGFRGEALASVADVSCLEISSRTSNSRETWSVILKGGKTLYCGAAVRWRRERPGTTICIRDAFYNLPIRRLSHPNPARTLELIRKDFESIALVFPQVAFSLENSAKETEEGGGRGRILTIPKTPSSLATFRHLFGRALCEHVDEVDISSGSLRIQGFFSLQGAHSKAHQYLCEEQFTQMAAIGLTSLVDVNRHPLSACDLHRVIDTRFAASSFGKHALDEAGRTRSPRPGVRRSPRKNERRPVYVLDVTVPSRSVDNCMEPAKAMVHFEHPEAVSNFVSSVVQSFLVRHGFSSNVAKKTIRTPPSLHKRRKLTTDEQRPKVWRKPSTPVALFPPDCKDAPPSRGHADGADLTADLTVDARELRWADPATGKIYMVDSKTGNSYPMNVDRDECANEEGDDRNREKRRVLVDTRLLRKRMEPSCDRGGAVPDWLERVLDGWEDPTFGLQEPGAPPLTSLSSSSRQARSPRDTQLALQSDKPGRVFDPNLTAGRKNNAADASASFDKAALSCAEVIGQVDKKFIACLLKNGKDLAKTLILVDQHAADERIRVERFLSVLCQGFLGHATSRGVQTQEMQPPVPILLTRPEANALSASHAYRQAFGRWGFRFAQMPDPPAPDEVMRADEYVQVLVETVPELLLLGDELRELVKGFLGKLEAEGDSYVVGPRDVSGANWTAALRWCPRELRELVNSKACRGAIMFNDTLDIEQCQRLISQLSDTVWPFMCAHGRPSLVPLTNVEHERRKAKEINWSSLEDVQL